MVDQRRRAQILAVDQTQVDAFADDPGVVGDGRTDDFRGEHERRVVVERCVHMLFGQFHAVALDAREADLAGIPIRRDRPDGYRLTRLRLFGHHRLGGEVERYAEHVGVFDVEHAVFVQIVGLPAQGAANYLLAQELRAERGKHSVYRCGAAGHTRIGVLRDEGWEGSGGVRTAVRRRAGAR